MKLDLRAADERLSELNATAVQQVLRRADKSFKAFFRRVKQREKPGYPRFKPAKRFHSISFIHGDGAKFTPKPRPTLYIQNVGDIKVKQHRGLPDNAVIKQIRVLCKNRKWYCLVTIALLEPANVPVNSGPSVGIDMGIHWLLATSDGRKLRNPHWFREAQARLRVAQRHLSRCKRGSVRRRKAALRVAKIHDYIKRKRRDFWHKVTTKLVKRYGIIVLEELSLAFMIQNHHMAKSAVDASLGTFQELLRYKAEEAGTTLVFVNPRNTSQLCSGCGHVVKKNLGVRVHRCPNCGLVLDRDVNAARNILARAEPSELNVSRGTVRAPRSSSL